MGSGVSRHNQGERAELTALRELHQVKDVIVKNENGDVPGEIVPQRQQRRRTLSIIQTQSLHPNANPGHESQSSAPRRKISYVLERGHTTPFGHLPMPGEGNKSLPNNRIEDSASSSVEARESVQNSTSVPESQTNDHYLLDELSSKAKNQLLLFTTDLNTCGDMSEILHLVDKAFVDLFPNSEAIIHLNPDYAARYQRFLRRHANTVNPDARRLISRLEIGFEESLINLIGLRSLEEIKQKSPVGPSKASDQQYELGEGKKIRRTQSCANDEDDGMYAVGCPIYSGLRKYFPDPGEELPATEREFIDKNIIAVCEISRKGKSSLDSFGKMQTCSEPPNIAEMGSYGEEDATLLAAACVPLGQALERICITSDLTKHLDWSKMLLKMSETLNSNLDATAIIESAIEMLRDVLFSERGSMYLVDDSVNPPNLWTMVTDDSNKDNNVLKELRIPFGKGIAGTVAESEQIIMIEDAYKDSRFNPEVDKRTGLKTTSILCVPAFSSDGRLVAVIQMINKRDTDGGWTASFDNDDIEILKKFSGNVSVALNNAKVTAKNKYNEEIANNLLNNMFPEHITKQVKRRNELLALGAKEERTATAYDLRSAEGSLSSLLNPIVESYDKVFVFFSDIVSFTTLSMTWKPEEVVNLLNDLFTQLDLLSAKHNVYKLETIGDAYVACSNLPFMGEESERHAAENLARFAVDATEFVKRFMTREGRQIAIRAGMHCGPCFGGVVGVRMPRFCLMGDTMNTASRMESTGEAGKVHISEDLKNVLCDKSHSSPAFTEFQFEDLGEMEVKGKGEMQTYFMTAPAPNTKGFEGSLLDEEARFAYLQQNKEKDGDAKNSIPCSTDPSKEEEEVKTKD